MRLAKLAAGIILGLIVTAFVMPTRAQVGTKTTVSSTLPRIDRAASRDWPLHSLDLSNSRYAPLSEIDASNVHRLTVSWSFDAQTRLGSVTPVVVDGVMYFNAGSKLFAINAATGGSIWTLELSPGFPVEGRGPAYGDGNIYASGGTSVYAVHAKAGRLVESFGDKGLLAIVNKAFEFKYPGRYPATFDPLTLGFTALTSPPSYHGGTMYVGLGRSDSLIPGGPMIAVDGTTGTVKWVFNPVPQGPEDDGWEVAKDTWIGGIRAGGGIWTPPAIDPDLGLIYFNVTNPSATFDGSARKGMNLFSNSIVALHLATGKLAWYYQTLHHDIWDFDLVSGPVLFDVTAGGRTIKGIGSAGKTCYLYLLNRSNGEPINPIVESPMPTRTDVPGEEVWPTQPIPHTSRGVPQTPFCATYPIVKDPELAKRVRPFLHPFSANELVITAPGVTGGANYGPPSFSPRTGLVYVTGKNDAQSIKVRPVGNTLRPGDKRFGGYYDTIAMAGETGVTPTATLAAYEPVTGERAWYAELSGRTNTGHLVTAGDLLFQGIGNDFYALDARTGNTVFKTTIKGTIDASPMTYQIDGRQYVSVVATNRVYAWALPERAPTR